MTEVLESGPAAGPSGGQQSLGTAAARTLATTTKTRPQMREITPRWLLRMLPWEEVPGGAFRVNRRLSYAVGDGRLTFSVTAGTVRVVPPELRELPLLREFGDDAVLEELAGRFRQREFPAGAVLAGAGQPADTLFLLAHGKANRVGEGAHGARPVLGTLVDGDHFGGHGLLDRDATWDCEVTAVTTCLVLTLPRAEFAALADRSASLREHVEAVRSSPRRPQNKLGEAEIALSAGHAGETALPGAFADYEQAPREYELSVAQTLLKVHTRVADLYNEPMDQVGEQLRLTVAALRERQEQELLTNPEFGLLANADLKQRVPTRTGPPTPDDLDEVLSRRRSSHFFLAHPRAIAAFGRECTRLGLYPAPVQVQGRTVQSWRGVPILPSDKIPVSDRNTTSILVMRTGLASQGVVGLHRTGLPDEHEPGVSVRFTGIDDRAILSYLVSTYYSAAVLVPDALGVLENVQIGL